MFEQLLEMVQQQAQQSVVANPEVPNAHNEAVMNEAASSIQSGMQQMAQQGGPGAIKSLFEGVQNGDQSNPGVQQLSGNFAGNIMEKFGISKSTAMTIAASLIPVVLGKMMSRAKDPNDSGFNLSNILGSIMGGGANNAQPQMANAAPGMAGGNMMDTISSMATQFGMDKNGDGKTDLADLMKMFA